VTFDEKSSLALVGQSLSLTHLIGDVDEIRVRDVKIVDRSLTVEVLASSEDPMLLRGQAASVMGGLSGLDLGELFPVLEFETFAVRLVNSRGEDVFWVMSSPEDANFAQFGAVRWLANSLFQDNTPNYRRTQADRLIGRLETGLRDLLHMHWIEAHGSGYAPKVVSPTLLKNLRKQARSEGEDDTDDRALLDFTLLPQLAESVCSEPLLVTDGCVVDQEQLKLDLMGSLGL